MSKPRIVSIAGGKGGVGKSFLTANLAIALAEQGVRITAIDMDLGGSNLHNFLGISNKYAGIGDFINTPKATLAEYRVDTGINNLSFIPGDGITPFMANISFLKKEKLIKGIRRLDSDLVLLDLGAGTTYNTLDFFNMANRGILVTKPDFLSTISMLSFLKNAMIRKIDRQIRKSERSRKKLEELVRKPMDGDPFTIAKIAEEIALMNPDDSKWIADLCSRFRPGIIFNLGSDANEMSIIDQFSTGMKNILSIEADYFGFVMEDKSVSMSIHEKIPFINYSGSSVSAIEVKQIAKRMIKYLEKKIERSGTLLRESTEAFLKKKENEKKE